MGSGSPSLIQWALSASLPYLQPYPINNPPLTYLPCQRRQSYNSWGFCRRGIRLSSDKSQRRFESHRRRHSHSRLRWMHHLLLSQSMKCHYSCLCHSAMGLSFCRRRRRLNVTWVFLWRHFQRGRKADRRGRGDHPAMRRKRMWRHTGSIKEEKSK